MGSGSQIYHKPDAPTMNHHNLFSLLNGGYLTAFALHPQQSQKISYNRLPYFVLSRAEMKQRLRQAMHF